MGISKLSEKNPQQKQVYELIKHNNEQHNLHLGHT